MIFRPPAYAFGSAPVPKNVPDPLVEDANATTSGPERKIPNSIPSPVQAVLGQMYWGQLASNPVDPVNPVKRRGRQAAWG